jgi:cold-inducible RNA-binding protein
VIATYLPLSAFLTRQVKNAKKLFVGGLSFDTTDEGLNQAFGAFGTLEEAKIITDRASEAVDGQATAGNGHQFRAWSARLQRR